MFVAREEELTALEDLYRRNAFQMVVVYGRRRVGKTTLIDEFTRGKRTLYFTAKQQTTALNLAEFSAKVRACFDLPEVLPPFATWADALDFVARQTENERIVFVFDELPYAAESDPSLPSTLQVAIDHGFKQGKAFMVLCGSNEGFMESEVLGKKSPLYGRRTAQLHLQPFDYYDAARMLEGLQPEELVRTYAAFGGTPYYLEQIDPSQSFENNVARLVFNKLGMLYEEPAMLLRQELREPATYNSVLAAISAGATEPARIASAAGVAPNSVGKYLRVLRNLGLVERRVPFGDNPDRSRRSSYALSDPFFSFWYRFVGPATDAIELGAGRALAQQVCAGEALATYEGPQFERICLQWVARKNARGELPFLATAFGGWWGTDPKLREETDIDLIAANKQQRSILLGECKWRNRFDETEALDELRRRAELVPGTWARRWYCLFSKKPASKGTRAKAAASDSTLLVDAQMLYDLSARPQA